MIGNIQERSVSRSKPPIAPTLPTRTAGFPKAQHRSKQPSAFLQSRAPQPSQPPPALDRLSISSPSPTPANADTISEQEAEANARLVENMTEEEREAERQAILERFGSNIGDVLKKARLARSSTKGHPLHSSLKPPPTPVPEPTSDEEQPKRKLRFANVTPSDVYVYESQPPSPKREPILLLPADPNDSTVTSLKPLSSAAAARTLRHASKEDLHEPSEAEDPPPLEATLPGKDLVAKEDEEGTPADIRRRFFPTARLDDPSIEWMASSSSPSSSSPAPPPASSEATETRYDLSGDPIPPHLLSTLPTHLGLHHHADAAQQAGYTLSDLLLLARSTVAAQRSAMLEVLAGVLRRLRTGKTSKGKDIPEKLKVSDTEEARGKIIAVGVEGLDAKNTTIVVRAVEVCWEGIVGWDLDRDCAPANPWVFVETSEGNSNDLVATLPVEYLFSVFNSHFRTGELARESLQQLLDILHRLATHSASNAEAVMKEEGLVRSVVSAFVLSSDEEQDNDVEKREDQVVRALSLLSILAQTSRENAARLVEGGTPDLLMRFIAVLPSSPSSSSPSSLPSGINPVEIRRLEGVLRFFATLGRYGMYTGIVTSGREIWNALGVWVLEALEHLPPTSSSNRTRRIRERTLSLASAYLELMEIWLVCARDPHKTSPPHSIRWSQVGAWGWGSEDLWALREAFLSSCLASDTEGVNASSSDSQDLGASSSSSSTSDEEETVMAALFNALAAWLEGCDVNGVRAGEGEKTEAVRRFGEARVERAFIGRVVQGVERILDGGAADVRVLEKLEKKAAVLNAAVRLQSASRIRKVVDDSDDEEEEEEEVTYEDEALTLFESMAVLDSLCERILVHRTLWRWDSDRRPSWSYVLLRPVTNLLFLHLRTTLDRNSSILPWLRSAFGTIVRLVPGDAPLSRWLIGSIGDLITPSLLSETLGWKIKVPEQVWAEGGMSIIVPFLAFALQPAYDEPEEDDPLQIGTPIHIAPYMITPESISTATRQFLPSGAILRRRLDEDGDGGAEKKQKKSEKVYGLPAPRDWVFAPLNDLLRSGTSKAFSTLTTDWHASETDVVRATMVFAGVAQAVLSSSASSSSSGANLLWSHAETVFGCMRVYMLELGQKQEDAGDEVFRDEFVKSAMTALLARSAAVSSSSPSTAMLEKVARRFLGNATPFYQLYTDFVALYDAISFSDALFGALLIPPLAMPYPADYRKLLWTDFGHVMRTIRVEIGASPMVVPVKEIPSFLWPLEENVDVLGGYVGALCKGQVYGVLRLVGLHHVTSHVWPDLWDLDGGKKDWSEEKAKSMFMMLVSQAPTDVIREVVCYWQGAAGVDKVVLPPQCFAIDKQPGEWRVRRLELVSRWGGEKLKARLAGLLNM